MTIGCHFTCGEKSSNTSAHLMSRFVDWDQDKAGTETGVTAGRQRLDVSRGVPLSVRVPTGSSRYAVAGWHRICCFFTNRPLIT
jgi:hypothetical protein